MLVFTFYCSQAATSLLHSFLKFIDFSTGRAHRKGTEKMFLFTSEMKKKNLTMSSVFAKTRIPCMIFVHCSPIKVIMSHIVYKACFLLSIHFAHVDV